MNDNIMIALVEQLKRLNDNIEVHNNLAIESIEILNEAAFDELLEEFIEEESSH